MQLCLRLLRLHVYFSFVSCVRCVCYVLSCVRCVLCVGWKHNWQTSSLTSSATSWSASSWFINHPWTSHFTSAIIIIILIIHHVPSLKYLPTHRDRSHIPRQSGNQRKPTLRHRIHRTTPVKLPLSLRPVVTLWCCAVHVLSYRRAYLPL